MVYPRPQTSQGESVAKPETLLLSFVIDINGVRGNYSTPFFKKKVHGQKHARQVTKGRNSGPYIRYFILSKYWQHPVQYNPCQGREGHHRPSIFPSVEHQLQINTDTPHQSDFWMEIIYQCIIRVSIRTNPDVIRRKDIAYLTGFRVYSPNCNHWDRKIYRHHGS